MGDQEFDRWIARAKTVLIEDICAQRRIGLRRKTAHEREGPCPVCGGEDRFSINIAKQVFNCRGCQRGGDVIELVQFVDHCDFHQAVESLTGEKPPNGKYQEEVKRKDNAKWQPVGRRTHDHTFEYQDENGRTIYGNARFVFKLPDQSLEINPETGKAAKTFRHLRFDGKDWSGVEGAMKGVEFVPYRLPDLLEAMANDLTVFIVEGERKADLLWSWGLPATCNSGGTGYGPAQWPSIARWLSGADVIILPDNDDAGKRHAGTVARALQRHALSIRTLELPNLPAKGDVIDWHRAGGTREKLDDLVGEAKPWSEKPEEVVRKLATVRLNSWEGREVRPREWLVKDRIPRRNVCLFSGDGAAGKTTAALQLCTNTVRATDWLGAVIEHAGPAVFFSGEEEEDEIHRRVDKIIGHFGVNYPMLGDFHIKCLPDEDAMLGVPDKQGIIRGTPLLGELEELACDIKAALIVIEAVADVYAGDEIKRDQVRGFVALLRHMAMRSGAAVVLLGHPSLAGMASGSGISGSTAWNNSVRSRLYLTSPPGVEGETPDPNRRVMQVKKNNYGPPGEVVNLIWQDGVYVPDNRGADQYKLDATDNAYLHCLDLCVSRGMEINFNPGKGGASNVFASMPEGQQYGFHELNRAQERLLQSGRIEPYQSGPPSRSRTRIRRVIR